MEKNEAVAGLPHSLPSKFLLPPPLGPTLLQLLLKSEANMIQTPEGVGRERKITEEI